MSVSTSGTTSSKSLPIAERIQGHCSLWGALGSPELRSQLIYIRDVAPEGIATPGIKDVVPEWVLGELGWGEKKRKRSEIPEGNYEIIDVDDDSDEEEAPKAKVKECKRLAWVAEAEKYCSPCRKAKLKCLRRLVPGGTSAKAHSCVRCYWHRGRCDLVSLLRSGGIVGPQRWLARHDGFPKPGDEDWGSVEEPDLPPVKRKTTKMKAKIPAGEKRGRKKRKQNNEAKIGETRERTKAQVTKPKPDVPAPSLETSIQVVEELPVEVPRWLTTLFAPRRSPAPGPSRGSSMIRQEPDARRSGEGKPTGWKEPVNRVGSRQATVEDLEKDVQELKRMTNVVMKGIEWVVMSQLQQASYMSGSYDQGQDLLKRLEGQPGGSVGPGGVRVRK